MLITNHSTTPSVSLSGHWRHWGNLIAFILMPTPTGLDLIPRQYLSRRRIAAWPNVKQSRRRQRLGLIWADFSRSLLLVATPINRREEHSKGLLRHPSINFVGKIYGARIAVLTIPTSTSSVSTDALSLMSSLDRRRNMGNLSVRGFHREVAFEWYFMKRSIIHCRAADSWRIRCGSPSEESDFIQSMNGFKWFE